MKFIVLAIICVALLSGVAPASPAELGRLFFTPEQRKELERHQQQESATNGHTLTVNGIVQKTGGERTVWINGVPQAAGDHGEQIPDGVTIAVPGLARPAEVKVGQKLSLPPTEP